MSMQQLPVFTRCPELEKSIDKKLVWCYRSFGSLTAYSEILSELVSEFNIQHDRYSLSKLHDFLQKSNRGIDSLDQSLGYTAPERNYIETFSSHLSSIKELIIGKRLSNREFKSHLISLFQEAIRQYTDPEQQIEFIKSEISEFKHLYSALSKRGNNFALIIPHLEYYVSLVNDPVSYEINNKNHIESIIVNGDLSDIPEIVKKSYNVDRISFRCSKGKFIDVLIDNPFDSCMRAITRTIRKLRQRQNASDFPKVIEIIEKVRHEIDKVNDTALPRIGKHDEFTLQDIKQLRNRINTAHQQVHDLYLMDINEIQFVLDDLKSLRRILSATHNKIKGELRLDQNIMFSLGQIKSDFELYHLSGLKHSDKNSFGEENLNAILASNLRCLYKELKIVAIRRESKAAKGRMDIQLAFGNQTFGIIESKLIEKRTDVIDKTAEGLDQLFERYSEVVSAEGDPNLALYLVIFAYDKHIPTLAEKIKEAVETYPGRNGLEYIKIHESDSENSIIFSYEDDRDKHGLMEKRRTIKIIICKMVIEEKSAIKQRTKQSSYNPKA